MRAKLIYNPAAGRAAGASRMKKIMRSLADGGIEAEIGVVGRPGDARQFAVSARDGTRMARHRPGPGHCPCRRC